MSNCEVIKLKLSAKQEINEIERSKEEVKNNEHKLLNAETKIFKLSIDLIMKEEIYCIIL